MSNTKTPIWERWTQFRFSVIGELLFSPPPRGQLQKTFSHLDAKIYQHPIDLERKINLGDSTVPDNAKVARNPEIVAVYRRFCGKPGCLVRNFPDEAMADVNSNP